MIGLAVGVRRVVGMPVPRLHRGFSLGMPGRRPLHLPLALRRARA